ncbi:MAG TPA: sulfatase-like hydrolase/transferase [Terrimicrobiaceae bacterium]|nr:sulfatase-like hydrolase/transferase [Terrimicrobiaceae bacterium]
MAHKPLNILLITSDQQHWSLLGCLNREVKTPHLDRLAAQGTLFRRAYCTNPTCTPSRSSIITGMMPSAHGAWSLGTKLREDVPTVGDVFQAGGYATDLIGKAHFQPLRGTEAYPSLEAYPGLQDLDFWRGFHGPFYGFQHVELNRSHGDEAHVGQHYAAWMEDAGFAGWRKHFRAPTGTTSGEYGAWSLPEEYHYNAWIAERTNARLSRHAGSGTPFFLWASFPDPHPPYLVPEPWASMFDPDELTLPGPVPGEHDLNPEHFRKTQEENPDFGLMANEQPNGNSGHGCHSHLKSPSERARDLALYYGMMAMTDHYVGKILAHLEETGMADNTLVLFTSDHGHLYGQHGMTAKGPFHYEDLIRVPMIVRWPGHVPEGRQSDALQSLVDLSPTFLAAAGIGIPPFMCGVNQLPVWTGACESARSDVVVENRHQPNAIHMRTYVDSRYKLTIYRSQPYGELFDLLEDPGEVRNLWNDPASSGLRSDLTRKLLDAVMANEPIWMPRVGSA